MSTHLSPENEAFLSEVVAKREFADRDAALDRAVGLLLRREVLGAVNAGVEQLRAGQVHRYAPDELERFLTDIEAREKQQFPQRVAFMGGDVLSDRACGDLAKIRHDIAPDNPSAADSYPSSLSPV